ncbi:MAG TPA: hypothetical protein VN081_03100 [Dongiaceae bacterium]|nr:hypothetical protein [Dongiaceae bacterium]
MHKRLYLQDLCIAIRLPYTSIVDVHVEKELKPTYVKDLKKGDHVRLEKYGDVILHNVEDAGLYTV